MDAARNQAGTIGSGSGNPPARRHCKPRHWDIGFIRNHMVVLGPVSSLFDMATFAVLLLVLQASELHTGWFVESLSTQSLVLFVIRTAGNPLKSRPSAPLTASVLCVVAIGLLLPAMPIAPALGFVRLPMVFYAFLAATVASYLAVVEVIKRRLMQPHVDARTA